MRKKFSLILLFIFLFSNAFSAQTVLPQISESLLKKAAQTKSLAKTTAADEENISVMFYPQNGDSNNVDASFFNLRGIEYIRSRNFIGAKVPADMVSSLDQIKGVERIDLGVKVKALGAISEGIKEVNASKYLYNNVDGAGVKIAVIDVGFSRYRYLQNIGELPANLVTKDFTKPGAPAINELFETIIHGSACAEVIYDFVPQAQIYLLKIADEIGVASLQNALDYCKDEGIQIASVSLGFAVGFWPDGTGIYAQLATEAYNNGILPVFAAGNEAEYSWFGKFNGNSSNWMVFPSGNDYLELNIYGRGDVCMMWDDFTDRDKKYTMYMYDASSGSLIDTSSWAPGNTPSVYVRNGYSASRRVRIKILKENTFENVDIRLCFDGYYANSGQMISESSICSPGDSREALTVGAVNVANYSNGPIDSYSSRGPVRKPSSSTTSLTQMRKPDMVAPSYVSTTVYGTRRFNGTSAATPHVAGAAALLLSWELSQGKTMSVNRLKNEMLANYMRIASSPDNTYGIGKLYLGASDLSEIIVEDIVCYPNPVSISKKGSIKITNLPYDTSLVNVNVYTVAGEFVKSFSSSDLKMHKGRVTIEWDLKNQSGSQVAPGVYFCVIKTPETGKKVKKIAIQK
ncbi:MAG: S8 family serine peptidase [Endomicrobia bacterium]|nr:S8 family serine peptidase [Endomicrobiia bacterium]